jgi:hypothetical protein
VEWSKRTAATTNQVVAVALIGNQPHEHDKS